MKSARSNNSRMRGRQQSSRSRNEVDFDGGGHDGGGVSQMTHFDISISKRDDFDDDDLRSSIFTKKK